MSDHRIERTKQYLRDAMLGLLRKKPFADITVREVVDRAQVSKNSFYNHYANLEALVQDCFLQQTVFFRRPYKRLRDYACRHDACTETLNERANIFAFFKENPNLARVILDNVCMSPYFEESRDAEMDLLVDHIDTEYGDAWLPFLSKRNCAYFLVCGLYGHARMWLANGMRAPIEKVVKEGIYYALHGLAGIAGHHIEPEYLQAIKDWHYKEAAPSETHGA